MDVLYIIEESYNRPSYDLILLQYDIPSMGLTTSIQLEASADEYGDEVALPNARLAASAPAEANLKR